MSAGSPLSGGRTLAVTGAGLALIAVCYGLARFAYGLFVPALRAEFGLTDPVAGLIAAGSYVSYCLAVLAVTVLTPRFGGRALAVTAGCLACGGTLAIATAPNASVLAVGVLVAGSSTGVASPALAYAVEHRVRPAVRGRTQAMINAGTGAGVAIAAPVALFTHQQWRLAWLVFAGLAALTTLVAAVVVPTGPRSRAAVAWARPRLPGGAARLLAAAGMLGLATSAVWTFGRDLLVRVGQLGQADSLLAWMLLGAFGLVGAGAGDLAHRFGARATWSGLLVLLGLAVAMLAALPGDRWVAWIGAAVFGATYIALTGVLLMWGIAVYPRAPATGVGYAFLVLALAQAAGAALVGVLIGALGSQTAFGLSALVALLGALIRPEAMCVPARTKPAPDPHRCRSGAGSRWGE